MILRPVRSRAAGFTMLEVVIAIGLISMLIGMVFAIARSSLVLGKNVVETQNQEMLQQAFFELLAQRFSALPGNTRFDLKVEDSGGQVLSTLTLQKVPLGFTWGGQTRIAKAVQLVTSRGKRDRFISIVLRYYENEILEDSAAPTGSNRTVDEKPFAEIVLLTDVAYFEWNVLDGRTLEWQSDWDVQGRMPLQLELFMAIGARGEEMRHVFWIAPKQNPEVALRQSLQSGGGAQPVPGQPGQPVPGQPGNINLPAGGVSIAPPGSSKPNPPKK